eukprot:TRINITY_DN9601_c0_g1_i1.p1 TRINITY_DN9601_c0_g1~~TRINITY_DN9601_c0_g1_i1.p1  ORF type:complete len:254 (-),score=43.60 TRINITY_DN9601_c0_g1_i1:106-867(-)
MQGIKIHTHPNLHCISYLRMILSGMIFQHIAKQRYSVVSSRLILRQTSFQYENDRGNAQREIRVKSRTDSRQTKFNQIGQRNIIGAPESSEWAQQKGQIEPHGGMMNARGQQAGIQNNLDMVSQYLKEDLGKPPVQEVPAPLPPRRSQKVEQPPVQGFAPTLEEMLSNGPARDESSRVQNRQVTNTLANDMATLKKRMINIRGNNAEAIVTDGNPQPKSDSYKKALERRLNAAMNPQRKERLRELLRQENTVK